MLLEVEAALAGRLCQGFHPAMIEIRTAIEHDSDNTGRLGTLGNQLANRARRILVRAGLQRGLQILVQRRGRGNGRTRRVIDDLRINMLAGTEDRQTRTARRLLPELVAKTSAKKTMIRVPMKEGRTLHHDIRGTFGAGDVVIRAAPAGTGIIAGGPLRAVFETLGIGDVVAKSLGSRNPHNMVKATFAALAGVTSPRLVASRRGKKVADLYGTTVKEVPVEASDV